MSRCEGTTFGERVLGRRRFLAASVAAVGLGGLMPRGASAVPRAARVGPMSSATGAPQDRWATFQVPEALGVQLYTVRREMEDDPEGTLATIAEIGYREVELWRLHGLTPSEMRRILDGQGLRAVSSHDSLEVIRSDWPRRLEAAAELGQSYLVCPSIPRSERTPDGYRRIADDFNAAGEAAGLMGMGLGYHNHDHEFTALDGVVPYDLLLERCEPGLVAMQADLFWMVNAGVDPLAYFTAYPGRFFSVHVKDRTADGTMVDVGEGVIDFTSIFAHAEQAGIRHAFVEHDRPSDAIKSVRNGFNHLSHLDES